MTLAYPVYENIDGQLVLLSDDDAKAAIAAGRLHQVIGQMAVLLTTAEETALRAQWAEADAASVSLAKAKAFDAIDLKAESVRLRYITAGAGQAGTYIEKAAEAETFRAALYLGEVPPMVQAEVQATGASAKSACDAILAQRDAWILKGAQIEAARRSAKVTITAVPDGDTADIQKAREQAISAIDAL